MNVILAADRQRLAALYSSGWQVSADVATAVSRILADVRAGGDSAIIDYTRRFDDPTFDSARMRVAIPMREQSRALVAPEIVDALSLAKERVSHFVAAQKRSDVAFSDDDGTAYGYCSRPLDSVAVYVARGSVASPSAVIRSVVPAKMAGVARVIVLTPPQADGRIDPAVMFACSLCDVDELYAVGGAQAIAAAAYGTSSIASVEKIVGSGNAYVTEAKRQVFGTCAIDGLVGSSEVLVVADDGAQSEFVVGELLAQAEKDANARVAVVSESRSLLDAVAQLLDTLDVKTLPRGDIIGAVIEKNCYLVHALSKKEIFDVVDRFSPERLSLQVRDSKAYLPFVRHAGAIYVGDATPVACGDYVAGTSGHTIADFTRSFAVVENSAERMARDIAPMTALAEFEGLPQHAQSARMRNGQ